MKIFSFFFSFLLMLSSCNKDNLSKINTIHLQEQSSILVQPIDALFTFTVEGDNSQNLTTNANFKVNGESIDGNTFTTGMAGTYQIQAFYNGFESNVLVIEVVNPSDYSQKVLVEDYTGTWCGYCPRVAHAINLTKETSDKVVSVAVHITDDYTFEGAASLRTTFGVGGLPVGKINRINTWTQLTEHEHLEEVLDRTGFNAPLGLAIQSEITGNTINMSIRVGFDSNVTNPINIVVYLVESGLIHNQTNYTAFFGGAGTLIDFEHNDVLRAIYTDILGTPIPLSEAIEDNIYQIDLQKTIPVSVADASHTHLVAFVVDANTREVINVQEAPVGANVGFQ